jgi:hypothetical protein
MADAGCEPPDDSPAASHDKVPHHAVVTVPAPFGASEQGRDGPPKPDPGANDLDILASPVHLAPSLGRFAVHGT